jgi:hypothetical protein
VEVTYPDGRVALTAFWGYLARGGLVLFEHDELREGEPVALDLRIAGARTEVNGVVVRSGPAGSTVVAFAEAEGSGCFLRAALAGPPIEGDTPVHDLDRAHAGVQQGARLVSLGEPGCTLTLRNDDSGALAVGARVELALSGGAVRGDVVWARGRDRGVMFDDDDDVNNAVASTLERARR